MMISTLPTVTVAYIITKWIDLRSVARMDIALCNSSGREVWLTLLRSKETLFDACHIQGVDASAAAFVKWLISRRINVLSILATGGLLLGDAPNLDVCGRLLAQFVCQSTETRCLTFDSSDSSELGFMSHLTRGACTCLTSIRLSRRIESIKDVDQMTNLLIECPLLEVLTGVTCDGDGVADAILNCLPRHCPSLLELGLTSHHGVSVRAFEAFAEGCPRLKKLTFTTAGTIQGLQGTKLGVPIRLPFLKELVIEMRSGSSEAHRNIRLNDWLMALCSHAPCLVTLSVKSTGYWPPLADFVCNLSDGGLKAIARGCPNLESLLIQLPRPYERPIVDPVYFISDDGMLLLMRSCKSMKSLVLVGVANQSSDAVLRELKAGTWPLLEEYFCRSVPGRDEWSMDEMVSLLHRRPELVVLFEDWAQFQPFSDEELITLFYNFPPCLEKLEEILLDGEGNTDAVLVPLTEGFGPKRASISWTNDSDFSVDGLLRLTEAQPHWNSAVLDWWGYMLCYPDELLKERLEAQELLLQRMETVKARFEAAQEELIAVTEEVAAGEKDILRARELVSQLETIQNSSSFAQVAEICRLAKETRDYLFGLQ
jgi:hypothetical protein